MLAPNWIAFRARSCPIRPVIGCSSSVVLKPSVAAFTTRRSSEASRAWGLAATDVTSPFTRGGASLCCERLKNMQYDTCLLCPSGHYSPNAFMERPRGPAASNSTRFPASVPIAKLTFRRLESMAILRGYPDATQDGRQSQAAFEICRGVARLLKAHGFAAVCEVSLANGRRADVVGVSEQGWIWIVEIKSSIEDFRSD